MTTKGRAAALIAITGVFLYSSLRGIGWGLPGPERSAIVLPPALRNADFYALMVRQRDEVYAMSGGSSTGWMPGKAAPGESPMMKVLGVGRGGRLDAGGRKEALAGFVRPYLLRSQHPDEQMSVASLAGMKPAKLDFNPRQFQYGGAYIYPLGAWFAALGKAGLLTLTGDLARYFEDPALMARIFLAGRVFNLFFGLASLWLLYAGGRRHFGERAGLVSAALFASLPSVMFQAHVMKPYLPGTCFALAAVFFALNALDEEDGVRSYLLSGAFAGLAAGAMSVYGMAAAAPAAAFLLSRKRSPRCLAAAAAAAAAAFFLSNPYWLLDRAMVASQLSSYSAGKGMHVSFLPYFLMKQLPVGTGFVFLALAAAGSAYAVAGRRRKEALVAAAALVPLVVTGLAFKLPFSVQSVRIALPWLALLCTLAGVLAQALLDGPRTRAAGALLLALALAELTARSAVVGRNFELDSSSASTRYLAARWISANVPAGAAVGLLDLPQPALTPPMDFTRYKVSVLLGSGDLRGLDYLVCYGPQKENLPPGGLEPAAEFRPYAPWWGLGYSMGLTSLNGEVAVYRVEGAGPRPI